jgi:GH25 family lysozyme M1 (1,4-beta-N-acetylmuramidase)
MTNGCDIASYQGTVDFDRLKPAVSFVIAKATEGTSFIDATFAHNWTEAKRVGLRRGAYHFARPDLGLNAQDEARHFLSILGPLDSADILALDYEVDWGGYVVGWCKVWLDAVKLATGITPYIYLNLYLSHVYDWGAIAKPGGYPLWLADYDGLPNTEIQTPWPTVAIKQWTSTGTLPGIQGNVDLNTGFALEEEVTNETLIAMLNDPAVAEKVNTFIALKEVDAAQAAAIRQLAGTGSHVSDAELARIITVMGTALEKVGADVAPKP